jgi:hypothetical protein
MHWDSARSISSIGSIVALSIPILALFPANRPGEVIVLKDVVTKSPSLPQSQNVPAPTENRPFEFESGVGGVAGDREKFGQRQFLIAVKNFGSLDFGNRFFADRTGSQSLDFNRDGRFTFINEFEHSQSITIGSPRWYRWFWVQNSISVCENDG